MHDGCLMSDNFFVEQAVERLDGSLLTSTPTNPVRDILGATDIDLAYRVQNALNERRISRGARPTGRKIGLTSKAVQAQLGVDQPDFGVLFDDMEFSSGQDISIARLIQPKVETEIALRLGADLVGDITKDQVRDSVEFAVAALEIVDSRVDNWDISIVDTIADNGSSALYVLGDQEVPFSDLVPREVTMVMQVDGKEVSHGTGRDCLGDPLDAVHWLALKAESYGNPLRAGDLILSGALGPMAPISIAQTVIAEISGLGTVSAQFVGEVQA